MLASECYVSDYTSLYKFGTHLLHFPDRSNGKSYNMHVLIFYTSNFLELETFMIGKI